MATPGNQNARPPIKLPSQPTGLTGAQTKPNTPPSTPVIKSPQAIPLRTHSPSEPSTRGAPRARMVGNPRSNSSERVRPSVQGAPPGQIPPGPGVPPPNVANRGTPRGRGSHRNRGNAARRGMNPNPSPTPAQSNPNVGNASPSPAVHQNPGPPPAQNTPPGKALPVGCKFCMECGVPRVPGSKFCGECGNRF